MDSSKRNLLILTSSFPLHPADETCGYIRDFARSMSTEFNVQVLAPPDSRASAWPPDTFGLRRSRSLMGSREPFQGSRDFNDLFSRSLLTKLGLFFSVLSYLIEALRLSRQVDVICSHWLVPSGLIGSAAACLLRKPHVVVEHSGALHLLRRTCGGEWITRFIVRRSREVVVVSSDLRNKLIELCPEAHLKVRVMPMGIALGHSDAGAGRESAEGRQSKGTILFVGRLIEIKGLEVLLRAMEGVEGWRLLIAGSGRLSAQLARLAAELRVDARFIGHVEADGRSRLFRLADVVVIPSLVLADGRTEGTPLVCLEALAAGRPIVCSRVGGLPEIIIDGENGMLVEPGNPQALGDKLKDVLGDRRLRHKLSVNARRTAAAFDWSQVGTRFSEIIKGSIRKNGQNVSARGFEARRTND